MTSLFVLLVALLSMMCLAAWELRRLHDRDAHTKAVRRLQARHHIATVLHWDGD